MVNENKKLYSNTKQTKNKIKHSLLQLLKEKELAKINITEIVEMAGIYRATFYIHYSNLGDVVVDIEKDIHNKYHTIEDEMSDIDIYNNFGKLIETVGSYLDEDKDYLKIIINTNCFNRLTLRLKDLLESIVISNFQNFGRLKESDTFLTSINFITGGIVFAYRDWINNSAIDITELNKQLLKFSKKILIK